MNNGIPSFNVNALHPYRPVGQTPDVQRPAAASTEATQATRQTPASNGLSRTEQQMIDRYFPPAPALTLRLYGPGRATQDVNPGAVGSRLDLKG